MTVPDEKLQVANPCLSPRLPSPGRNAFDLSNAELQRASVAAPEAVRDYPRHKCVHHLFEEQVARTPDATAVVCDDRRLSYRELNECANQLAQQLQGDGVGPEVRVGICVRRSLEMIIGLLGVLKAGGAYVPIDPLYPRERTAFLLRNSNAPVLLTQQHLLESLPQHEAKTICVNTLPTANPVANPARDRVTSGNLAYVIYTSGSTGKPKGVMVGHRNVVNFFAGMDDVIGATPGVWLALTSISFDISVLELFWTLTRGFKVVIQADDWVPGAMDSEKRGRSIAEQIAAHNVTHLQCTPSQAALLVEDTQTLSALRRLKKILLGGEALPRELAARLAGDRDLYNMYGPTETTVWSTAAKLSGGDVTIGRPLANTWIYIVDENQKLVEPGVAGELWIGGDGVTRGYLDRPELTAEKFLDDPFRNEPGARAYRTGDLARLRSDGLVEFLGRVDHQIKLRGHRVELGEIESVLAQHPSMHRAIVVAREDQPGDQRLVAYVIAREGQLDVAELRKFLQSQLPDYMVPAAFVSLAEFPLTPNGKIDRQALPRPAAESAVMTPFEPAQSRLEKTIAAIWQELLQVERVGLNDNFFELGGHSVLIARVHSRLRDALHIDIPITRLFQFPTVASLAKSLGDNTEPKSALGKVRDRARRQQALFRTATSRSTISLSSRNGPARVEDKRENIPHESTRIS